MTQHNYDDNAKIDDLLHKLTQLKIKYEVNYIHILEENYKLAKTHDWDLDIFIYPNETSIRFELRRSPNDYGHDEEAEIEELCLCETTNLDTLLEVLHDELIGIEVR